MSQEEFAKRLGFKGNRQTRISQIERAKYTYPPDYEIVQALKRELQIPGVPGEEEAESPPADERPNPGGQRRAAPVKG